MSANLLTPSLITNNLASVRRRIHSAAERAGRDPSAIQLIAVTKGQPSLVIESALIAGLRLFGENYIEEAETKIAAAGSSAEWHMIGHVQSRKAVKAAVLFSAVHSVDSLALARRLSRFAAAQSKVLPVYLECNVSGEETKFGFSASDRSTWPALLESWREISSLPALKLEGLMTMAPYGSDPQAARPAFRMLRELGEACRQALPEFPCKKLSMGMSDDFETAVEEGATALRIGRALFGLRVHG